MGEVMYSGGGSWGPEREITVTVGHGEERRSFRSRVDLLSEQSGYFRSLLDSCTSEEIAVPSVSPEVFARILKFVNTGLLDLTPDNIYSVLLATHLLHMPRALELCRSYLVLERHRLLSTPPPPSIVKPIPSRKYFFWPPPPPFFSLPPPPPHYPSSLYAPPVAPPPPEPEVDPLPSTSLSTSLAPQDPPPEPTTDKSGKSVYKDIACCDGPVRFKRVLNVNYGVATPPPDAKPDDTKDTVQRRVFICSFCKHTFKSHYCFRKHTRRHLNPVSLNPVRAPERDAKDMNVQYFPCKTCGSKFPSYYFVHKHRKLCHGAPEHPDDTQHPDDTHHPDDTQHPDDAEHHNENEKPSPRLTPLPTDSNNP
ncbi:hypothetical protein GE061_000167 [Apolygus lucorum]|uniref:BTB domain-containing protein n=1 Tax=Apolygus lucorum TaxID=248454 RepID=A0A8S9Y3H0_APOLU|nr:hypothetical protein GE061_000167 [Apolygus lucorum]